MKGAKKMKRRLAAAASAVVGLAILGVPLGTAAPAGASVARPAQPPVPTGVHRILPHRHENVMALADRVRSASMAPASVQPVSQFSPPCYGDVRSMSVNVGTLRPASFGAFYNCTQQEWTFEVQTADTWAKNSLGDWTVFIDTDGNFPKNDPCGGDEYQAFVAQTHVTGQFVGGVFSTTPSGNNCVVGPLLTAGALSTITANTVAISFPASAINNSPSLAWDGLLDNRAQEADGTGNLVPSPDFVDGPLTGGILDSVPGPSPSAAACTAAGVAGAQSATTSDSHRAAEVLRNAGFGKVHDYGKGIIAFTGNAVTAQQTLTAAGISARISHSEPFEPTGGTTTPPDDPLVNSQWNLTAINASGAWAVTTGSNVVVADVDSGVDFTQSDLGSPQLVAGVDMSSGAPVSINYASGNTDTEPGDPLGHGTAVAGVIAAATDNNNLLASLGRNTSVMPVKVDFNNDAQVDSQIAAGIDWAADNTTNPVKVINLSLGGPCQDPTIQAAISHAQSKGILVVAAAGNMALSKGFDSRIATHPNDLSFNNPPSYPAAYSGVLAVGATGFDGYRAAYSNTGSYVSMMAPGGSGDGVDNHEIPVLKPLGGTGPDQGTSFAAPQVAAAAALILSVNPGLTANQVAELIRSSATQLGVAGTDGLNGAGDGNSNTDIEYGTGLLNAGAAVADAPSPMPACAPAPAAPTLPCGYGTYYSLFEPRRLLDTRDGIGVARKGTIGPNSQIDLRVEGFGGVPSSGVAAVVLNVTVTSPTASSFVTVWPTGQPRPNASNLNFTAGQTVANLVTVKVGAGGQVSLYNYAGNTHLIADVAGYYGDGTIDPAPGGSTFVPLSPPVRLEDSRPGSSQKGPIVGPIQGGTQENDLLIGGVGPVPTDATAVVLNVTVTSPTAAGWLTVYPETVLQQNPPPMTSNLNFSKNQTVPNQVVVDLKSSSPSAASFFVSAGSANIIVDLAGYFTGPGDPSGSRFFPVVDHRILDTRTNIGGFSTPIGAKQAIDVAVTGQGGVIDGTNGATAVVMNTTATAPTASSYMTVYPDDAALPIASNLNYGARLTVPNLVSTALGKTSGAVDIFNYAGTVQAIADVAGWYNTPGT
jgi:hypothetical protein